MPVFPTTRRASRIASTTLGVALSATFGLTGCALDSVDATGSNAVPTFEEFAAQTYQEPWQDGVFIVNGDTPVPDLKKLREFYDSAYNDGALIVHSPGGAMAKWPNETAQNLTYCVSDEFGEFKAQTLDAMAQAGGAWSAAANVKFVHVAGEDANCNAANQNVVFDVGLVQNQPYLARAFFPNDRRANRNVLIDSSSFAGDLGAITLIGILRHELGHTLGFRHEHTRPEAGTCFEDNQWTALTEYDRGSVMHYPQCNGNGNSDLSLTASDIAGAASLYGAPGTGGGGGEEPPPAGGTQVEASVSATLAQGQQQRYQPLAIVGGTRFTATMTGTGDADLYVRFNAAPTLGTFDCRPYLLGSAEICDLDVPADATEVHLMIDGYSAATFDLSATWVQP